MLKYLLMYGYLPMIMSPDEGDAGGAGGDDGAGGFDDQGSDDSSGDSGADDQGDDSSSDAGGAGSDDAGGDDNQGGDDGAGDQGDDSSSDDDGDDQDDKKGIWSEKWREEYAGEDKKKLTYLNRFTSPKDLMDKVFEQDKLIRSGAHKKELGENPSDEDLAKYREENGIPKDAEGYLDKMPDGLVIGEDLKEEAKGYLESMHALNASPEIVAAGMLEYQKQQEEYAEMVSARDKESADNAQNELRETWGADYNSNIQALHNFIDGQFPEDVRQAFMDGRLGDETGTPLLSHPAVIEVFSKMQRELNPLGATTSGTGMDNIDTINDTIKSYEKEMGTKAWYNDEKKQQHYRDLVSARDRYAKRA